MRLAYTGAGFVAGVATLLLAGTAQAQFPLSIVAGPTIANISSDEYDTSSKVGFFVALGTAFPINETFSISPFVGYVQKGAKFKGTENADDGEDTYSYIEIPVFITAGFPVSETINFGVGLGPQISFNMKCNESIPGEDDFDCKDYQDYVGSTDFGIVGSAGLQFPMGSSQIGVGGGFDFGMKDIFEDFEGGYKNRGFYLYVSYGMVLGG